jgi:hypothetical protein
MKQTVIALQLHDLGDETWQEFNDRHAAVKRSILKAKGWEGKSDEEVCALFAIDDFELDPLTTLLFEELLMWQKELMDLLEQLRSLPLDDSKRPH